MREEIAYNSWLEGRRRSRLPPLPQYWIDCIRGSADFLGLNYYTSVYVERKEVESWPFPSYERDRMLNSSVDPEWASGKSVWLKAVPSGLGDLLKYTLNYNCFRTERNVMSIFIFAFSFFKRRYNNPPIFITENGWSTEGQLNDPDRIEYLCTHMEQVLNAIDDGSNIIGYTGETHIKRKRFNQYHYRLLQQFGL